MNSTNLFWQVYLNLEDEVVRLSKYIFFTDTTIKIDKKTKLTKTLDNNWHLEVYSSYISDLLIRCCVEIEAISKELYFDNGGSKIRGSNDIYFDTDCLSLLNQKFKLGIKTVIVSASTFNFKKEENQILTPLKDADKRSKTYWAKAYQAVKHDRYNSLYRGTIKALLHAMSALYLLNIYYRDEKLYAKFNTVGQLDMSFGSKIFALKTPSIVGTLGSITRGTDCPYIVKYTDSTYKSIVEKRVQECIRQEKYWLDQPELNEPMFQQQLIDAKTRENENPQKRVMQIWELCKYRLNKKIPASLPFEEKKKRFIQSEEWRSHVRQINKHLKEDELTEENIQEEMEHAAIQMGMTLEQQFITNWIGDVFNGECEIVLDKGEIKYNI